MLIIKRRGSFLSFGEAIEAWRYSLMRPLSPDQSIGRLLGSTVAIHPILDVNWASIRRALKCSDLQ